jgi:hypothetical protein
MWRIVITVLLLPQENSDCKDLGVFSDGATFFAEFDKVGYKPLTENRNQKKHKIRENTTIEPSGAAASVPEYCCPSFGAVVCRCGSERNRDVNQVVSYMKALVDFASWIRV